MALLVLIVLGTTLGWLASILARTEAPGDILRQIALGIVVSVVAGEIANEGTMIGSLSFLALGIALAATVAALVLYHANLIFAPLEQVFVLPAFQPRGRLAPVAIDMESVMKFTAKTTATLAVAVLGLSLAACEGKNENAMEDAGEANAEAVADKAEAMEDAGQITDAQEDAMVDKAEDKADAMEAQGEAMDNGTPAPQAQ